MKDKFFRRDPLLAEDRIVLIIAVRKMRSIYFLLAIRKVLTTRKSERIVRAFSVLHWLASSELSIVKAKPKPTSEESFDFKIK